MRRDTIHFLIGFPAIFLIMANIIDKKFSILKFKFPYSFIPAIPFMIAGASVVIWALTVLIMKGEGDRKPLRPTKKLVTTGPYRYCRHPMILGLIIYYTGISIWAGSLTALAMFALLMFFNIIYVKNIEEEGLEARFKEEYTRYRDKTPFLIPKLKKEKPLEQGT